MHASHVSRAALQTAKYLRTHMHTKHTYDGGPTKLIYANVCVVRVSLYVCRYVSNSHIKFLLVVEDFMPKDEAVIRVRLQV